MSTESLCSLRDFLHVYKGAVVVTKDDNGVTGEFLTSGLLPIKIRYVLFSLIRRPFLLK